jgi:hypothetical protein
MNFSQKSNFAQKRIFVQNSTWDKGDPYDFLSNFGQKIKPEMPPTRNEILATPLISLESLNND